VRGGWAKSLVAVQNGFFHASGSKEISGVSGTNVFVGIYTNNDLAPLELPGSNFLEEIGIEGRARLF
jgi:hypothetical protein